MLISISSVCACSLLNEIRAHLIEWFRRLSLSLLCTLGLAIIQACYDGIRAVCFADELADPISSRYIFTLCICIYTW